MSLRFILFIVAMLVELAGCVLLFLDALITRKTDMCQDPIAADFLGFHANRESGFFVLAVPTFSYEYNGKQYEGPSANQFWRLYLKPGGMIVPFTEGKSYGIYVDPNLPSRYITSGEQRITVFHVLSISIVLIGAAFLIFVMGLPE